MEKLKTCPSREANPPARILGCLEASVSITRAVVTAMAFLAINQIPSVQKPAAVIDSANPTINVLLEAILRLPSPELILALDGATQPGSYLLKKPWWVCFVLL